MSRELDTTIVFVSTEYLRSWAIANHTYGLQKMYKPSWYHVVIPNYFDASEFEFSAKKEDYYLYLGRISVCKGVQIAIQITNTLNEKLIIAGQGDPISELGLKKLPDNVEFIGYADAETRKRLLKNAKGLFLISDYIEPFGGTTMEAMLSGTPVITSDWGVFTETVLHGVTGFRCRTFEQFLWATKNIHLINSNACQQWALNNYSLEKVSTMYEEYFLQLQHLWSGGWYESNNKRCDLNWLYQQHPVSSPFVGKAEDAQKFMATIKKDYINTTPRVAIWIDKTNAFGRIHSALIKYMKDYKFSWFEWSSIDESNLLWKNGNWRKF